MFDLLKLDFGAFHSRSLQIKLMRVNTSHWAGNSAAGAPVDAAKPAVYSLPQPVSEADQSLIRRSTNRTKLAWSGAWMWARPIAPGGL